jgi:hypothetical protein
MSHLPSFDPEIEPEAICGNCDSWKEDLNGNHHCLNGRSPLETLLTDFNDHCAKFFPDPTRWPEADHG